ncbi:hypothetical protein LTR78_007764 [Recurvomyces mirabilis]|uniref:Uncharacterized protein n=1 Tax=Recurvomyces mirabilis TaxID=574656 RepID=A0AAE0TRG3_9PEZI|nr:hypothetical protein LTR78_007764 [Recurvomyces mirabilis]KAK5151652.1 hypothetical protein LTS14_009139 [Recurvomyces mirabilis]
MERSNNGAYGRTQNVLPGWTADGRASTESQRIVRKRSTLGVRNASQPLPSSRTTLQAQHHGAAYVDGSQARKSSLRNVVRKIFGRRSKEIPAVQQKSPPRHAYHRSEPSALVPHVEEADNGPDDMAVAQRTFSVPLQSPPSPGLHRTRSPYAVEFPHSARLKPLNLGDPYYAPGSQLRRRKTMPSVLLTEEDDPDLTSPPKDPAVPAFEVTRDAPVPEPARGSTSRSMKRRSRSADDLRQSLADRQEYPPRKRSDEIRFWRESFQGSVLRASGFVSRENSSMGLEESMPEPMPELRDEDVPISDNTGPIDTRQSRSGTIGTFRSSPPGHGHTFSQTDVRSASGYGTELSRDLEDRVAKLESGLHDFQRSLARLTADRNRQTVMVGGMPQRRSSLNARTPSMLADTLSDPLTLAYTLYGQPEQQRPSTSPQPPRTPTRNTAPSRPPVPPLPMGSDRIREAYSTPPPNTTRGPTSHPVQARQSDTSENNSDGQPQPYTFRSLYEMLTDERSARRRLEGQLRGMRQEISDLQYHVSSSQVQSQRSSFVPMEPVAGSSRIRDLLRETEQSPPGSSSVTQYPHLPQLQQPSQALRDSGNTVFTTSTGGRGGLMSRFSHSDSEAGAMADSTDDLETPYEAYQTPLEERHRTPFGTVGEIDMF